MKKIENYDNLDFLKIIFTVVIILYHFIRRMGFWCEGAYAFNIFFMISGFLCVITFDKNLSTIDFIKKKYFSFLPFLILSILTLIPLKGFLPSKILNNVLLTPVYYDLFILIAWYINVWFWLSLCLFYLQKTVKNERINLIVFLSVFISIYLMLAYNSWMVWPKIGFVSGGWLIGIAGMGMGYLLALIPKQEESSSYLKYLFYTALESYFLCYTVGCMFIKSWYISPYFVFVSSCILFFLFLQKRGALSQITNISFFKSLRRFILPVYLLQQAPLELFYSLFDKNNLLFMSYPYLIIVLTTIFVVSWGICGYYVIRLLRSLYFLTQR